MLLSHFPDVKKEALRGSLSQGCKISKAQRPSLRWVCRNPSLRPFLQFAAIGLIKGMMWISAVYRVGHSSFIRAAGAQCSLSKQMNILSTSSKNSSHLLSSCSCKALCQMLLRIILYHPYEAGPRNIITLQMRRLRLKEFKITYSRYRVIDSGFELRLSDPTYPNDIILYLILSTTSHQCLREKPNIYWWYLLTATKCQM